MNKDVHPASVWMTKLCSGWTPGRNGATIRLEVHMHRLLVLAAVWFLRPGFAAAAEPVEVKFDQVNAIKQRRTVVPSWSKLARPIVCKLDFEVDSGGIPVSVVPAECPEEIHENAVKSSLKWQFEPHKVDGQNVPVKFRMVLKITH